MNRGACVSKTRDLCDFHPDCPGGEDERLPMCCKFSFFLFFSLCFKLFSTKDSKDESDEESNVDNELYLPYILYPPQLKVDMKLMIAAPVC